MGTVPNLAAQIKPHARHSVWSVVGAMAPAVTYVGPAILGGTEAGAEAWLPALSFDESPAGCICAMSNKCRNISGFVMAVAVRSATRCFELT